METRRQCKDNSDVVRERALSLDIEYSLKLLFRYKGDVIICRDKQSLRDSIRRRLSVTCKGSSSDSGM